MIKQLLQREFLLKSAGTLVKTTENTIEEAHTEDIQKLLNENNLSVEDLEAAKNALQNSINQERNCPPGEHDKSSFIPRDPILSLAQSALQSFCEEKRSDEIKPNPEIDGFDDQSKIPVTDKELSAEFASQLAGESVDGFFGKFELGDIGWANTLLAIGVRNLRGTHPFNPVPAAPYTISDNARVILFSDWGSGLPRAQKVADQMRVELEKADAENREVHVIHLGDVYYSGWAHEYEKNFLPYFPVKKDEADKFTSWCLNANHDMYSGGDGYFDFLLADERFKHQQKSSFFSLENKNFLILGLDTGYHDHRLSDPHDLHGDQNTWVYEKLSANTDKASVLLSHHQPFSPYEHGGEKLLEKLKQPLEEKLVTAWFWGHEHRCTVYTEQHNIKYPRLIGHAGIPFYVNKKPLPDIVQYEYCEGFRDSNEDWNYFGFAVLDFAEDKIKVRYINEFGEVHYEETIQK
jgi:hypothetical protein